MSPTKDEFTRVSVHEAGHFVLGRSVGFEATEMRISLAQLGRWSGFVRFRSSRAEDILNAEREGRSLQAVREKWGVDSKEFDRLRGILEIQKPSLVRKLMMRALAGAAADSELGGGNETMGESDYMKARDFARALVPEDLVTELMQGVMNDARRQAAGPLRNAILTVAERLRRRRHFDAKALAQLWHEACPGPWHGLGKIQSSDQ